MQKKIMAAALAAVLMSSAAQSQVIYDKDGSSVDVYGRVQAVFYSQDTGSNNNAANDAAFTASSRLGFNFASEINSYVSAIANVEWDAADDDQFDTFENRTTFVGADFGAFGSIIVGKFEDAVYQGVESATDILDDWGCVAQFGNDDRRSGSALYSWSGFGFDFMASVNTAKDGVPVGGAFMTDEEADIKFGYGLSLGYTTPEVVVGPIGIKLGYGSVDFQDVDDADRANYDENGDSPYAGYYDNYRHFAAALTWGTTDEGLYLAALFSQRSFELNTENTRGAGFILDNDYDVTGVEVVASYAFTNGVSVTASYQYLNVDEDGADGVDVEGSCLPVYVNYQINPNVNVWAEARFALSVDDSSDERHNLAAVTNDVGNIEENVFSVGLRYTF